jgi:hypothetical protein
LATDNFLSAAKTIHLQCILAADVLNFVSCNLTMYNNGDTSWTDSRRKDTI